jgi:hypothetical protein
LCEVIIPLQRLSLLFAKDVFLGHECTGEMGHSARKATGIDRSLRPLDFAPAFGRAVAALRGPFLARMKAWPSGGNLRLLTRLFAQVISVEIVEAARDSLVIGQA